MRGGQEDGVVFSFGVTKCLYHIFPFMFFLRVALS